MQNWWRVLRGVWPYRWMVALSMLCALGVGMSYASGVAVMLPVMKIFVSTEGVHGWANRTVAERRMNVDMLDLDSTVRELQRPGKNGEVNPKDADQIAIFVRANNPKAVPPLNTAAFGDRIVRLRNLDNAAKTESRNWQGMVWILAHAEVGEHIEFDLVSSKGPPTTGTLVTPGSSWYYRSLIRVTGLLPADPWQSLVWVVLFFILLCIIGSLFRYWQQFLGMTVANRVVMDIRRRMYDRVVQLPTGYFAQQGTSNAMSRLTQDTNTLTDGVSMALGKAIQEPMKAAFAFGLAWWLDWRMALGVVVSMPILGIIIRKFSKRMRRAAKGALENWARMLAIINETLIGVRVVKAYSAEGYERRRFARVNKDLLAEQIKLNHYASLSRPTIETLAVGLVAIPMLFAAYYVLRGQIDKEAFFTLIACFAAMIEPMRKLADVNAKVQQTNAAAARVFEVVDMDPEPNHRNNLPKLPRHSQSIEFRDVSFSYPGHEELVLQNISFTAQAGQNVAVVGGNGSGKTTLLALLPRLYMPTTGAVLIDGTDLGSVSLRSLRKQIGLVTQDTLLFADTIYHNIAYGTRHATREHVMDAARRAYVDEFVAGFPEGYDTKVGEHGVRLSGGQKQRIAIARAILRDPAILVLDEAMSQIDSDSETKISAALRDFQQGRTTFMIAHRFQTVITADMIVCLDAGKIVGLGSHTHLMANCAPYRKLYENQFREAPADAVVV